MNKIIEAIITIIIALGLLFAQHPDSSSGQEAPPPSIGEPLVIVKDDDGTACQEDEPCWDCHTMGNLICGPIPVPANPGFTG